jgi:hypothetical protein
LDGIFGGMDPSSYVSRHISRQENCIGYPANLAYDYTPLIKSAPDIFRCHFNNIGPVNEPSNYQINTKDVEKQVLQYFCSLWKFDIDKVRTRERKASAAHDAPCEFVKKKNITEEGSVSKHDLGTLQGLGKRCIYAFLQLDWNFSIKMILF